MRCPRPLALGIVLLPLVGCAGAPDSFLAPLGTIEPGAGPPEAADAATTETAALQIMSGVIAGDLLVGGDAATRMLAAPQVMPAAGPEGEPGAVEIGDGTATAQAARTAAFERVTATQEADRRRQTQQALLLERWMSARVAPAQLTRADIRRAQQLLTELGYEPGPIDGIMGRRTRAAVERFQADQGLAVSGDLTPALIDRLAIES